jgi:hypothetical protein
LWWSKITFTVSSSSSTTFCLSMVDLDVDYNMYPTSLILVSSHLLALHPLPL